jgi:uncharacterized membrane protein YkvA (DUF1232 family)
MLNKWREQIQQLKRETYALYLAYRHPATPRLAKIWTLVVVAYALSPIDLIPDFIPVLGYLDDLILIPLGVAIAIKLIPPDVMRECRERAVQVEADSNLGKSAAIVIAIIWILALIFIGWWLFQFFN